MLSAKAADGGVADTEAGGWSWTHRCRWVQLRVRVPVVCPCGQYHRNAHLWTCKMLVRARVLHIGVASVLLVGVVACRLRSAWLLCRVVP